MLSNGLEMPSIGLGTYKLKSKEALVHAIMNAGYLHIDNAMRYKNEEVVGEALAECFDLGKKREDLFITTKIFYKQYNDVEGAIRETLNKLKLDYVDLYLIHWPLGYYSEPQMPLHQVWP